ncbi:autotransporter domain-containing protein [Bradyrhizobium neotropicale]|uniref:autotransporter domain-containing protein n=1 Tax=Bradyrhizobium neotropicale TaxID=1497615 RepID=UPI001AD64DCC|nr:autotransporter domain-containing protein [Bradyrhizobium neotropicale]MBO4227924.1 autotransporter domain-containing protein [Bradyrhizobium neotropicale]
MTKPEDAAGCPAVGQFSNSRAGCCEVGLRALGLRALTPVSSLVLISSRATSFRRGLLCTTSLVALALLAATTIPSANAANIGWGGANSTDWFDPTNWLQTAVPTSGDNAGIDTTASNPTVIGTAGAQAGNVYIGQTATGELTIRGSGTLSSTEGYIGYGSGSTGIVTVDASSWTNGGALFVGYDGTGTLNIQNGAAVSNTFGLIGVNLGSNGAVTVDGAGSSWTNSSTLQVGVVGTGALTIRNSATVRSDGGNIGAGSGASGTVTVDGTGSSWINTADLSVGSSGTGTLTIQNGGAVSNSNGQIGLGPGSSGTVTVTGSGSSWTNTADLYVGSSGTGTLTIQNGGAVSSGGISYTSYLGYNSGSNGSVTVNGAGSSWTNGGLLFVGYGGAGTLMIQNGGAVSSNLGYIGHNSGSNGTVTVDGSSWTNHFDVRVGLGGTGTLTIRNGGTVSNDFGIVGNDSGSNGTVTVTGTGSSWTNTRELYVGSSGAGTLTIRNGGAVNNLNGQIGYVAGSRGTVTVDGPGSSWANTGELNVGSSGTGTLNIQNGGTVTSNPGATRGLASIGFSSGSSGAVTVDGAGSSWTNGGLLFVGNVGTGTLTIQNGGTVSSLVGGGLGYAAGSNGTATVTGAGSSWTNSFALFVGYGGTGTLTIQNGGSVSAPNFAIAGLAGSTGSLNIGAGLGQAAAAPGTLDAPTVAFAAGTGQIVFNHTAANYTFDPAVSGAGSVLVEAGKTILTADNTYTGATTVNGGILSVNGSIASSSLTTVNAGGALGGNGIVGNTLINGGTLAPGNSIGLLTVQGNLSFTAASSYLVEVSPANADRTNVTGTAALGGATVNAVFAPGSYVTKQYTILNATGGVSGTFSLVNTNLPASFTSSLSYDANNAFLNLTLNYGPNYGNDLNGNQRNLANTLTNFFNTTGGIPLAFGALTPAGLSVASGELGTGVIQSSMKADDLFLNLLLDSTVAGRAGGLATPDGVSRFGADDATLSYAAKRRATASEREAYAMASKAPPLAPQPVGRWSVWAAGYGGSETIGGNAAVGSQDTRAQVWGVAAGADYKLSPDTLVGFALGGGGTSYSLASGFGSGSADLFQAGAYGRHQFGSAYVSAAFAYGWHDVTTTRTVALAGFDSLQGRFRADSFSGRVEGGYRIATPLIGITPYAAVQVISLELPAYAERSLGVGGLFALNYAGQTTTDTRTELGLRTDKSFAMEDAVLTLRGRLAWAHDYNPDRAVSAIFQSLPGTSFVVNGARPDPDSALVSASAEQKWLNGFSLAATFEGEFSGNVTSYAGKGVVKYSW